MVPEELTGTEQVEEVVDTPTEATGPDDSSSGFNPAWEPIREKLGDSAFQLIQSELGKWDQGVSKRFETLNSQFSPYKDLGTPEELTQYKQIIDQIDANPEGLYEELGKFLTDNGRMPTKKEAQVIADDMEEAEPTSDPRIDELAQGQQRIQEFLAQQQQAEVNAQAESELSKEVSELETQRGYSKEDMQEVIRRAAFLSANSDKSIPLSVAADQFDALRERILTTPRPGDSAPRLLPTSGGNPSTQQNRSMGSMSRNETQDLIAAVLSQGNKA